MNKTLETIKKTRCQQITNLLNFLFGGGGKLDSWF